MGPNEGISERKKKNGVFLNKHKIQRRLRIRFEWVERSISIWFDLKRVCLHVLYLYFNSSGFSFHRNFFSLLYIFTRTHLTASCTAVGAKRVFD